MYNQDHLVLVDKYTTSWLYCVPALPFRMPGSPTNNVSRVRQTRECPLHMHTHTHIWNFRRTTKCYNTSQLKFLLVVKKMSGSLNNESVGNYSIIKCH